MRGGSVEYTSLGSGQLVVRRLPLPASTVTFSKDGLMSTMKDATNFATRVEAATTLGNVFDVHLTPKDFYELIKTLAKAGPDGHAVAARIRYTMHVVPSAVLAAAVEAPTPQTVGLEPERGHFSGPGRSIDATTASFKPFDLYVHGAALLDNGSATQARLHAVAADISSTIRARTDTPLETRMTRKGGIYVPVTNVEAVFKGGGPLVAPDVDKVKIKPKAANVNWYVKDGETLKFRDKRDKEQAGLYQVNTKSMFAVKSPPGSATFWLDWMDATDTIETVQRTTSDDLVSAFLFNYNLYHGRFEKVTPGKYGRRVAGFYSADFEDNVTDSGSEPNLARLSTLVGEAESCGYVHPENDPQLFEIPKGSDVAAIWVYVYAYENQENINFNTSRGRFFKVVIPKTETTSMLPSFLLSTTPERKAYDQLEKMAKSRSKWDYF